MSVLITGGSGFLGRALLDHYLASSDRVCIYSRGEWAQAQTVSALSADQQARTRAFIGDVRDLARLRRACDGIDTVIHAAALKRVEVGQYNPTEMVATNVLGTRNVIEACRQAGVRRLVLVSSDKACAPLNAYGCSKRLAEHLTLAAHDGRLRTAVVRYGNVAGSTGSVLPLWRSQALLGAPMTLRDGRATRFWMSLAEAVRLVAWAGDGGIDGGIAVPELPSYGVGGLFAAASRVWSPTPPTKSKKSTSTSSMAYSPTSPSPPLARPPTKSKKSTLTPTSNMAYSATETPASSLGAHEKMHEVMISQDELHLFERVQTEIGPLYLSSTGKTPLPRPVSSDTAFPLSVDDLVEKIKNLKWSEEIKCSG